MAQAVPLSAQHSSVWVNGDVQDDGSGEIAFGFGIGSEGTLVQRFTPGHYPYSYTQVCVAWVNEGGDPVLDFEIVIFDDDGTDGGPALSWQLSPRPWRAFLPTFLPRSSTPQRV